MTLYLEITRDEYELPVAVADSVAELSRITGVNKTTISSTISHYKAAGKTGRFIRVTIEDDD